MISPQQRAQLFDLVLRFNRRLEHITKKLAPELLINENHLLGELRAHPSITAHDLSRSLQMEKSMLSRMLAAIEKRGLAEAAVSKDDRRRKFLSLTPKGIAALEHDNRVRDQQVIQCIAALDQAEERELQMLLRKLADGFNSAALEGAEWENPVKIEIRRLTRSLGMLGDDYLGCGMSVENCQILNLVSQGGLSQRDQSSARCRMSELRQILPYEFSILSRMVSHLSATGLIEKEPGSKDRRQIILRLSAAGRARNQSNIEIGGNTLAAAMKQFGPQQVDRLCELIEKFVADDIQVASSSGARIIGDDAALRKEARAFVLAELVRRGLERDAPETILAAKSQIIVHSVDSRIDGVIELSPQSEIKLALARSDAEIRQMLNLVFEEKRARALKWDFSSKLCAALNQFSSPDELGSVSAKHFRQR